MNSLIFTHVSKTMYAPKYKTTRKMALISNLLFTYIIYSNLTFRFPIRHPFPAEEGGKLRHCGREVWKILTYEKGVALKAHPPGSIFFPCTVK